jgi:hypothetical protein
MAVTARLDLRPSVQDRQRSEHAAALAVDASLRYLVHNNQ